MSEMKTELNYRYAVSDDQLRHDYGKILSDLSKEQTALLGFENEISLCKAGLSTILSSGSAVDGETWKLALATIDAILKLQTEERKERERREKSELAKLKYKLQVQTLNSINLQEYHLALKEVQGCMEYFVPKEKLPEFYDRFQAIIQNSGKVVSVA